MDSSLVKSSPAFRLPFNTPHSDFSPVLSWDGNTLYFAKDKAPENFGTSNASDIWYTRRSGRSNWTPPINIGRPLNDEGFNIPIAISPLEDQLYLANVNPNGQYAYYQTSPAGRMWQRPEEMYFAWIKDGSFLATQIKSFHLSYDRRVLLFLAETENGCGQLDIYVSIKDKRDEWAYPFNIGPTLNSDFNECSVFLAADNRTLYFSSNGHGGHGGYDVFLSRRLDNSWVQWSAPINLGSSINSANDELNPAMSLIGDELFFNRQSNSGDHDLFSSVLAVKHRPYPQHIIHGAIKDYSDDFRLQVGSNLASTPSILQSNEGNYLTILPNQGSYLLFRLNPSGTFSESLPFFQQSFFDYNTDHYQRKLEENSKYQERESQIQLLKNDRVQLKKEIKKLENNQARYLSSIKQNILASLEQLKWDEEERKVLNILKQKYEHITAELTPMTPDSLKGKQIKLPADNRVVDKNDHFNKQKERLRQQIAKRKNEGSKRPLSDDLRTKGLTSVISFNQLFRETLNDLINEYAAVQWEKLEQQNFEDRLIKLGSIIGEEEVDRLKKNGLPSDDGVNPFLKSISSFPLSERPLLFPWQRDAESELKALLAPSFRKQLPALLQNLQRQVLDNKIILASKRHQAFLIYQKIQSAVNLQIAIERKIVPTESTVSLEASNRISANTSQLIQYHNFDLIPIENGTSIPLPGIVFEANTSRLSPLSEPEINRAIQFLKDYPAYKIELGVYSYGDVSHSLALELASQRAEILATIIINGGISADRIIKKPYGKKEVLDYRYSWRNNIVILKIVE